jgi:hypothetical protein
MPREFYIPKNATKITHKATGAVVYVYATESGKPCARGFSGKRTKPDFALYFANEGAREDYVRRYFEGLAKWGEMKAERRKARAGDNSTAKVGQVFVSSWGYEQTNVNFYEVVELVGKSSAKVAAIRSMESSGNWGEKYGDRGYVEPSDSPDRRTGQPFTAKVTRNGIASAKIAGRGGASAWDGKPLYWSAYA